MKAIKYIFTISLLLLLMMMFEGLLTNGDAMNFENYNTAGWIAQSLGVCFTVSLAILFVNQKKKN